MYRIDKISKINNIRTKFVLKFMSFDKVIRWLTCA